jgi:hypothetical protein
VTGRAARRQAGLPGALLLMAALVGLARAESCPPAPSLHRNDAQAAAAEALFRRHALRPAARPWASRPAGWIDARTLGARGDGRHDDTEALRAALADGRKVWLPGQRVFRISSRLDIAAGGGLAGNGRATLWMASSGFTNTVAARSDEALYGPRGVALRVAGDGVQVQGLHIVTERVEDRYVIAIDVRAAHDVRLAGLRIRGFGLAPGIVTIRSSLRTHLSDSLIHAACSESRTVPADLPSFQITGVSIDDSRVDGVSSGSLRLLNNVIRDLRLVPNTPRGDQSDGIHFAGVRSAGGSVVEGNHVSGVDEGVDVFGAGITIRRNRLAGRSLALKLIHGARDIDIADNNLHAGRIAAVGVFRAPHAAQTGLVEDIRVRGNQVHAGPGRAYVIDSGTDAPQSVVLEDNVERVARCDRVDTRCAEPGCIERGTRRLQASSGAACR